MSLSAQVRRGWGEIDALAGSWDRLLSACSSGVRGLDATCSSIWARALAQTHLKDCEPRFLTVSDGSEIVALLPTYAHRVRALPFARRELRAITEAHGGRTGVLTAGNAEMLTEFLLAHVRTELAPWDLLRLSVVEGSDSHVQILRAADRLRLRSRCIGIGESPYVELHASWQDTFASLPKKLRWTIRKSEKELRALGALEYVEIRDDSSARVLIDSIYSIERQSWKEQSGTSITAQQQQQRFYEALIQLAVQAGVLSAHLLRLDGRPIAYILGIAAGDGMFLDLKESFVADYREYSPGHVLKRFAIESLIGRGTRIYDFMGRCEPYKMRWTDKTYRTLTFALFNATARGSIWHLRSAVGGRSFPVNRVPGPSRAAAEAAPVTAE